MTVRQDLTHWQPRELVLQASQQSLESFVAAHVHFFLLVLLDEPDGELAMGLQALEASRDGEADGLGFRTVVRDLDSTMAHGVGGPGDRFGAPPSATRNLPFTPSNTNAADTVPRELLRQPCHIVPIQKRADRSFLQHVSVGRARNHDVVLRHRSVSKFHAWFELTENSRLMVRDSDSRNHTFVDGQQVEKRAEVAPGQVVRFGSVETRVCTAESLWLVMQQG
ncbi:MAG: FHA domain-containing protein [Polyangiales bacterium]